MSLQDQDRIRTLLAQWRDGNDRDARNQLFTHVYPYLHRRAAQELTKYGCISMGANSLVHESFLKVHGGGLHSAEPAAFYSLMAKVMRSLLIDRARARRNANSSISDQEDQVCSYLDAQLDGLPDILDIEAVLKSLESAQSPIARVLELRVFGGLTIDEITEELGLSKRKVERQWSIAQRLLGSIVIGRLS